MCLCALKHNKKYFILLLGNVVWLDKMTTARALLALSKDPDEYLKSTDTTANKDIKKQQSVESKLVMIYIVALVLHN